MKTYTTILFLVLGLNSFGQYNYNKSKISPRTQQIVTKIAKINEVMGSAVGFAGTRPPQYNNFMELQKVAKQSELTELTNHPNTTVRSYAFWALSLRPSAKLLPVLIRHINDTAKVSTMFGCMVGEEKVGDFLIARANDQNGSRRSSNFTAADAKYLDSVLIHTPNSLLARENAINRSK